MRPDVLHPPADASGLATGSSAAPCRAARVGRRCAASLPPARTLTIRLTHGLTPGPSRGAGTAVRLAGCTRDPAHDGPHLLRVCPGTPPPPFAPSAAASASTRPFRNRLLVEGGSRRGHAPGASA